MEFWYGMKPSEIAQELGITRRAVSSRKKNAFDSIRKNYKGDYNGKIDIETERLAVKGDKEAQLKVLQCYDSYINKFATVTKVLQNGKIYSYIDEDRKVEIQCILLDSLKKFRGFKQES